MHNFYILIAVPAFVLQLLNSQDIGLMANATGMIWLCCYLIKKP